MRLVPRSCSLLALIVSALACAGVFAQEVGNYPNAVSPLAGNERLVGDQNGATVNVTPSQLQGYLLPGGVQQIPTGGTGASNASDAINNLLPAQSGQTGNCLQTDGTSPFWATTCSGGSSSGSSTQFVQVTTNTLLSSTQTSVLANASAGSIIVMLPTAVGAQNNFYIKRIDSSSNAVTISTSLGQTIDGQPTYSIATQYVAVTLKSDNANWWITNLTSGSSGATAQFALLPSGQAINLPSGQGVLLP